MKRLLFIVGLATVAVVALLYTIALMRGTTLSFGQQSSAASPTDPPAPALTVRVLDVGQGDATYVHNGTSRAIIDGGPDEVRFGALLDSLGLNNSIIDVVVLSHQHADHYRGLLALFDSHRHIRVRYVFENKDPSTASTLARLRDSILARVQHDGLVYRDTDNPCANGQPLCTITMQGGAKLHILAPHPPPDDPNDRSAVVKLIGPDSASFSMWLAGDAEHDEIRYFQRAKYARNPGMRVDVLKADHHGSCNGVTTQYLNATHPSWLVVSLGAHNDYGHMHQQAKRLYEKAGIPWYRTDQNGTITIQSPGTPGSGYAIVPSRGTQNLAGPSDRTSRQGACNAK